MPEPAAVIPLLLLTGVWAWWAWKIGAYLGTIGVPITGVVFPGTIVLCAGTVLVAWTDLLPESIRGYLEGPLGVLLLVVVGTAVIYLLAWGSSKVWVGIFGRPTVEELRLDLRGVLQRCRPDWDISSEKQRSEWAIGEKAKFYPYGKTLAQALAEED